MSEYDYTSQIIYLLFIVLRDRYGKVATAQSWGSMFELLPTVTNIILKCGQYHDCWFKTQFVGKCKELLDRKKEFTNIYISFVWLRWLKHMLLGSVAMITLKMDIMNRFSSNKI